MSPNQGKLLADCCEGSQLFPLEGGQEAFVIAIHQILNPRVCIGRESHICDFLDEIHQFW